MVWMVLVNHWQYPHQGRALTAGEELLFDYGEQFGLPNDPEEEVLAEGNNSLSDDASTYEPSVYSGDSG